MRWENMDSIDVVSRYVISPSYHTGGLTQGRRIVPNRSLVPNITTSVI